MSSLIDSQGRTLVFIYCKDLLLRQGSSTSSIPNVETESLVIILCTIHYAVIPNADTSLPKRSLRAVIP